MGEFGEGFGKNVRNIIGHVCSGPFGDINGYFRALRSVTLVETDSKSIGEIQIGKIARVVCLPPREGDICNRTCGADSGQSLLCDHDGAGLERSLALALEGRAEEADDADDDECKEANGNDAFNEGERRGRSAAEGGGLRTEGGLWGQSRVLS